MRLRRLLILFDFRFLGFLLSNLLNRFEISYTFYKLIRKNPSLRIKENVQIKSPNRLEVGKNILIQKGTILHCGGMDWSDHKGHINIGDDSVISPYCIFYGAGGVEIGKRFECGPNVIITSSRTCYDAGLIGQRNEKRYLKKVTIGDDVILFSRVIINIGVNIGTGAVVGAGSLVLSDIPPGEFWGGVPAKFIKKRDKDAF
jgi:acetyltransferase-like isoleucine patch superfamily enzyme